MSNITPFAYEGEEVRFYAAGDSIEIVASDLAKQLGYRMASDMTRHLDEDEKGTRLVRTPGGEQEIATVTEAGMYRAIITRQTGRMTDKTRRTSIRAFQRWVTHEVLPAIRRTGAYATTPSVPQPDLSELSPRNLAYLSELAKGLEAAVKHAEKNQRKADGYDQFLNGSGCYLVGVKHRRLWEWLYTSKLLIPHGPRKRQPYANPKTASWFAVKTYNTDRTNGKARATTYSTPVGLEAIRLRLIREGVIQSTLFALPAPAQEVLA